ncbi:hypothetical protein [Paenibacillus sp. YYML68]|uniref:hypothetical protein n=1 Tax=Paenibacillus sp. YYML68 TaxID=2909250 RepID=UPI002492472C|nr:hypothetical protein [Paenibacillus sp. YYML68]
MRKKLVDKDEVERSNEELESVEGNPEGASTELPSEQPSEQSSERPKETEPSQPPVVLELVLVKWNKGVKYRGQWFMKGQRAQVKQTDYADLLRNGLIVPEDGE